MKTHGRILSSPLLAVATCVPLLALLATGCASSTADTTAAPSASPSKASPCGLGNGKKATGAPIKLGAIVTDTPGLSFTDVTDMANAYFSCVNANGGINGRPVELVVEKDALDPQLTASLATKLIDSEKVVGFTASTSVLDCSVNAKTYARKAVYGIDAGLIVDCFNSPAIAPVNVGSSYSALATAQYLLDKGAKKLVIFTSNTPGSNAINDSIKALGKKAGVPVTAWVENVPVSDANGLALKAARAAGSGGGVVVNLNAGEALKVFQAIQQQGLIDQALWGCPAGCNDESMLKQLGSAWDGKLGVNAEMNLASSSGPDNQLYLQLRRKYAPRTQLGNFGQLGFTAARIAVQALLGIKSGTYTTATVGDAFKAVKDFKSDLYCKPWYFGGQAFHTANNTTRTITPKNGQWTQAQGCSEIPALPNNNFGKIRAYEKQIGLG
ncbi:ABC transporter substrate-binding protein [Streptomyces sp. GbtcB7]|uniref:ABC transporter substrate-binding protein n=1 Tax=Streptomyces sp. GbtcB7 TaxID=2824752 RepID=UPI001C2F95A1|nr:ABC transporter substrate-binding protein [Streptomyces sp. GbtcB7]